MEAIVTKRVKLWEVCNDMCHNYYYLVHGKIYNDDKTRYRKFKFVVWFDIFDLQDYFEKDVIYKNDILEYVNELSYCNTSMIKSYDNTKDFYDFCRKSIEDYNRIC